MMGRLASLDPAHSVSLSRRPLVQPGFEGLPIPSKAFLGARDEDSALSVVFGALILFDLVVDRK
eukprot:4440162-Ditylum_brightwellii.AAC.1